MAITVQLGSVKKRANSTKRPTNLINYTGEIKSPCSALNPVIVFQMEGDPTSYNYAHISAWDRYYWVTDWTFDRGLWVATMRVDVLASWRDTIGTTNTYILRSASSYSGQIADTAYAPKSRIIQTINGNTNTSGYGWTGAYGAGTFVVGIINGATNTAGCVSYYVFTAGQFRTLCQKLFNDPSDYLDIDPSEISENLQRALVNPYQYIASAMWFPFEVAHGSLLSAVKFGWWQFNNNCYPIAEYGYSLNQLSFVVPQHPQSGSRGLYLNDSPYSRYTLFIPAFGEFEIPAAMLNGCPTISCDIVTDSITGVGTLRVKRTTTSGTEELFYR